MPPVKPTDAYARHAIPASEIEQAIQLIRSQPDYLSPPHLIEAYVGLGLKVFPDPFGPDITNLVTQALRTATPLSVVRLGDGELNLLSFEAYDTPHLDRYCVAASIEQQEDSFLPDELWMIVLREMMMSSMLQADIVGVCGLWRPRPVATEPFVNGLSNDPRGFWGQWRGIDYMLRIARSGLLSNKVLASAHLYFGLLHHLEEIVAHARRLLLITSNTGVLQGLRNRFPASTIDQLSIGKPRNPEDALPDVPRFLWTVASELPQDLRGTCCLVGAGPWAEFYCSWIKQRGGVALDIGSGFDLLSGTTSRPIHKTLGLDRVNPYAF